MIAKSCGGFTRRSDESAASGLKMTDRKSAMPRGIPGYILQTVVSSSLLLVAMVVAVHLSDASSLRAAIAGLKWQAIAVAMALFALGTLIAGIRLWLVARDLKSPISLHDALAAMTVGYLAGSLFFQLVGQTIARSALLARRGVPVAATLIMTGYERFVTLIVAFVLAVAGGWFLFGRIVIDTSQGGLEFVKLIVVIILATIAGALFGWGGKLSEVAATLDTPAFAGRAARIAAVSLGIQLCTMTAYIVLARSLEPAIPLSHLAAAASVVMFAAGLPISFAGWGVRELSAVMALSAVGMPADKALVVAVAIGLVSLIVVAILAAFALVTQPRSTITQGVAASHAANLIDYGLFLAWFLPLIAATAVFFQIFVPVGDGNVLNVNLADPAAIIGGILFVLWAVRDRRWPQWRLSGLTACIVAITGVFLVSFVIGWTTFGWSQWAFVNKLTGWFILLCYGATGALIASRAGGSGYGVLLLTFVGASIAIAGVDLLLLFISQAGFGLPDVLVIRRLEGFAQNRNAFAFQMVLVSLVVVAAVGRQIWAAAVLALCIAAVWYSGSRAGLITLIVVGIVAVFWLAEVRRTIVRATAAVVVMILAIRALPLLFQVDVAGDLGARTVMLTHEISDTERMVSIRGGLDYFLSSPLWGAGLGAFAENWLRQHGEILVIHSTPVWLLAEFGLIGAAIIVAPFTRILLQEIKRFTTDDEVAVVLVLICLAFGTMSLVHEMFYQRVFWLILGASLATLPRVKPCESARPSS